jgi:phage shock protein A
MSGLNDRSAFETFERMAEKIEESERRTLAAADVAESLSAGDSLEREFAMLKPASESVEFRLLQLKEQMGMLATGTERAALPGGKAESSNGPIAGEDGIVQDAELEEEA